MKKVNLPKYLEKNISKNVSVSVRTYNKVPIAKIVWYSPMIRKINQWKRVQGPERKTAA